MGYMNRSAFALLVFFSFLLFSCNSKKEASTDSDSVAWKMADPVKDTILVAEPIPEEKKEGCCACETSAYLIDEDTTGTNVRDTPKGKVIRKLQYDKDCGCLTVDFIDSKDGWLQLKDGGWVFGENFQVGSRNYGEKEIVYLNEFTTEESETVAQYVGETSFKIIGCENTWLYVKGKDGKKGWLTKESQCANPLTNCN